MVLQNNDDINTFFNKISLMPIHIQEFVVNIPETLLHFVIDSTKIFDDSHNAIHAVLVSYNACQIMKSLSDNYDEKFLLYTSLCHDICDHKYPNSISKNKLYEFLSEHMNDQMANDAMEIIDNISYSKEEKNRKKYCVHELQNEQLNDYMIAISDADKLEALGKTGIERCTEFTKSRGGKVPEDVIKHCHDKLMRLLPEYFIKSKIGRRMAIPLHNQIVEYVKNHEININ